MYPFSKFQEESYETEFSHFKVFLHIYLKLWHLLQLGSLQLLNLLQTCNEQMVIEMENFIRHLLCLIPLFFQAHGYSWQKYR
jgi:hypothetical protein